MYTKEQKRIIKYTERLVKKLFIDHPVSGHKFDHVLMVRKWAVEIAREEGGNVFLSELAALLHDVGRTRQKGHDFAHAHQEISYRMCREWFKKDLVLKKIPKEQKKELLYAVRYHWNDAADKFHVAIVLRDADKLDVLGKRGVERLKDVLGKNDNKMIGALRLLFAHHFWLRTGVAKRIAKEKNLFGPPTALYRALLGKKIMSV